MVETFLLGCSITVDGTLSLVVDRGGRVSGTAVGSYLYLRTACETTPVTGQQSVPITGSLSSTQFQLTIPLGVLGTERPVSVPLTSPTTARAETTDHAAGPPWSSTIELVCNGC
jgi:hypothetical protein